MSELLLKPGAGQQVISVGPESGLAYVGFEVLTLDPGVTVERHTETRELCVVIVHGRADISSAHGDWRQLGTREDPWGGPPDAAYLPPGTGFGVTAGAGGAEVALCWAPAPAGNVQARVLPGAEVRVEARGRGNHSRSIHPVLMEDREAESLLVCEVINPAGHWSSFPPHKHDRDDVPNQSLLEETYYYRVRPERGFGLQRVYTDDRSLDAAIAFGDRDCVVVPRGYHTVAAPPGYEVYYLNVMAGPHRRWLVVDDPDHHWTREVG